MADVLRHRCIAIEENDMFKVNPIAVFVATVLAFIASAVYYAGPLGTIWVELAGIDPATAPSGASCGYRTAPASSN